MMALVVGGAASGKSEYAERLLLKQAGEAKRVYLAMMEPFGDEARRRIEKHRAARRGRGFETIECYVNLKESKVTRGSAVLLEDMGNLCANELFSPNGAGEAAAESVLRGIAHLRENCDTLVIVSNEVFTGGTDYEGETLRYLSLLSYVNRRLAEMSDAVCEVSCGIATYYKGEEG